VVARLFCVQVAGNFCYSGGIITIEIYVMVIQIIVLALVLLLFLIISLCFGDTVARIKTVQNENLISDNDIANIVDKDPVVSDCFVANTECSGKAVGIEDIASGGVSIFWQSFTRINDPYTVGYRWQVQELSPAIMSSAIYERNGIHYIDNDVFTIDKNTEEKLDSKFAKLVESVVEV